MKSAKKVVHISTVHHFQDPRIMLKECQSLAAAGYDVTLLIQLDKQIPFTENGVKVRPLRKYKRRFLSMLLSPLEAYRKAKKMRADFYHFHDPELLPVGWMLRTKSNTVIYDVHEDYETGIKTRQYFNPLI